MTPIQVLAYIHAQHSSLWKNTANLTHTKLIEILELDCSPARITDALKDPSKATKAIVAALEDPAKQVQLAEMFGISALFDSLNETDLARHLPNLSAKVVPSEPASVHVIDRTTPAQNISSFKLSDTEQAVLGELRNSLENVKDTIVLWQAKRFSGANFLSSLLHPDAFSGEYERIVQISPSTLINPFGPEMNRLKELLGLTAAQLLNGREVARSLNEQKTLLVVKHAEYLPPIPRNQGANPLLNLVVECSRQRTKTDRPRILLIGKVSHRSRAISAFEFSAVCPKIQMSKNSAYDFFLDQFRRFNEVRGLERNYDEGGFRPKRARWHFEGETPDSLALNPIDIRVRAFFASDTRNYGYFDCTQGFKKLAGELWEDLPLDVREYHTAGQLYIEQLNQGDRNSELQVLRWISTGLYWVSESAMEVLRKRVDRIGTTTNISDQNLRGYLHDLREVVEQVRFKSGSNETLFFVAPLALKALVQDHWRENSPFDRSVAHYKIAERLYSKQNDKDILQFEFPFQPHWGRTRHYFVVETIRHLVRSFEGKRKTKFLDIDDGTGFPQPPTRDGRNDGTTDPIYTLRYCYDVLFGQELNGNRAASQARKLSNRHGAYHMTAEILQFFASDVGTNIPNDFLPHSHLRRFFDDVGYAKLDLGDLVGAKASFTNALEHSRTTQDRDGELKSLMDIALVCTVQGRKKNLVEAKDLIAQALTHPAVQASSVPMSGNSSKRKLRKIAKFRDRILSREAQIDYLEGRLDSAKSSYSRLDRASLKRDIAHSYIACLMRSKDDGSTDLALKICTRNVFENTSRAQHHEALGFRVALAHIYRKLNMVQAAEECLELVKSDVLEFGCSERTYQSFLLEAGRNLLAQDDREVRAYMIYLRPCFERSVERGFCRVARQARKYCLLSLDRIEERLFENEIPKLKPKQYVQEAMKPKTSNTSVTVRDRGDYLLDPLASYQENEVSSTALNRLTFPGGFEEERIWLRSFDIE